MDAYKSLKKWSEFDKVFFFLMLIFRDEGHLNTNCFFYVPTFYPKCLPLQFFNHAIHRHSHILTGGSKRHNSV